MLTKKHLEALAATIRESKENNGQYDTAAGTVCRFMRKVEVTPHFNVERFCKAAGLGEEWYDSFKAAAREVSKWSFD